MHPHGSQFTPARLVVLGLLSAAVVAWMAWMIVEFPPVGGTPPTAEERAEFYNPDGTIDWSPYVPAAIGSVALVLVVNALTVVAVRRRARRLPEHEKDWRGPDPHADRSIPVEAYSPSPVMRAAIKRTLNKQTTK